MSQSRRDFFGNLLLMFGLVPLLKRSVHKELVVPTVGWHKELKTQSEDEKYLEILADLERRGVPMCRGRWASHSGIDLDDLIRRFHE